MTLAATGAAAAALLGFATLNCLSCCCCCFVVLFLPVDAGTHFLAFCWLLSGVVNPPTYAAVAAAEPLYGVACAAGCLAASHGDPGEGFCADVGLAAGLGGPKPGCTFLGVPSAM